MLEKSKEATFKVQKSGAKSGFGDFYGNVKHYERVNEDVKMSKFIVSTSSQFRV